MTAYSDLQARVADWLDRTDLTSAQIDSFISLAEARFNRELIVPSRETTASLVVTTGTAALPTDYWAMRALYGTSTVAPTLKQVSVVELKNLYSSTSAGTPVNFAIQGLNLIVGPTPSSATTLTLDYYQTIPALTSGNTSNWLIVMAPDLYLSAVLAEAFLFLMNTEKATIWDSRTQAKIREVEKAGVRKMTGAAPLAPRGMANIPGVRA